MVMFTFTLEILQKGILEYLRQRPTARYTQKFLIWARATLREYSDPFLISRQEPDYVYNDWYDNEVPPPPFMVSFLPSLVFDGSCVDCIMMMVMRCVILQPPPVSPRRERPHNKSTPPSSPRMNGEWNTC